MLDIGWTELLIIGIVALIVVGPKDLPGLFRNLGRFMARIRSMGRDFQRAMENAADESGVKDVAREFKDAASSKDLGVDELSEVAKGPKHWKSRMKSGLKPDAPTAEETAEAAAPEAPAGPAELGTTAGEAGRDTAPGDPASRGPETEKLARSRAAESAARREQAAARRDAVRARKTAAEAAGARRATGPQDDAPQDDAPQSAPKDEPGGPKQGDA